MSGHSKFSNIKHRKERQDAKKGKVFTKIGREIAVAVKEGGSDLTLNSKLRDIVAKAKASNMPNDTISRSIKKAAGELGNINYEHITYEGYGPSGIAVIVDCLTENKNRTAANVRHAFSKNSGNLGTTGCVSFMFDKKGQIVIERAEDIDEDELMMIAIDAGAEDFVTGIDFYEIITTPDEFSSVNKAVGEAGYNSVSAEITMIPQTTSNLTDEEDISKMENLIDTLEEDDDVQNVWHNFDEN